MIFDVRITFKLQILLPTKYPIMENFIGLIIFFVAWIVISSLRKAAKKQQAANQQMMKNAGQQNRPVSRPASAVDEINKLIEMFTSGEIKTPAPASVPVDPASDYSGSFESVESTVEVGGKEDIPPAYSSLDQYVPYSSSLDDVNSENELHSMLSESVEKANVINRSENQSNPVLSDFDLKKAVIYSAILEPKYF
ncbi:hypothetical protein SDC9_74264 [bioreactor metagenome]|uniref:Uncharacterized protein n=1 Tax=bioreactor metagenome TaxID=1076179 RepID=A0A644YH20_9ZZZZ